LSKKINKQRKNTFAYKFTKKNPIRDTPKITNGSTNKDNQRLEPEIKH